MDADQFLNEGEAPLPPPGPVVPESAVPEYCLKDSELCGGSGGSAGGDVKDIGESSRVTSFCTNSTRLFWENL